MNKAVIVTGGTKGIGRAIIEQYLPENCQPSTKYSIARTLSSVAPVIPKWNAIAATGGVTFLYPFADSNLFDFVISAPEKIRLNCFQTKPLIKKLF